MKFKVYEIFETIVEVDVSAIDIRKHIKKRDALSIAKTMAYSKCDNHKIKKTLISQRCFSEQDPPEKIIINKGKYKK